MYATREAIAAFRRTPVLTGLSAAMIALSLFVVGVFTLVAHNVRQVIATVESRVEIVAYLRDDAEPSAVELAHRQIAEFDEVRSVRYVSREEALATAREELHELSGIFGALETNPLPASLEIALEPAHSAEAVRDVARRIENYRFFEEVQYGNEWLDLVFLLRRVAAATTVVLGAGFALVAALIIGAAVRMAVFARREEIAIMRLVGATDAFIRRPFVLEGMITGLIGALLALAGTWGVYLLLSDAVLTLSWLPPAWPAIGVLAGALVGLLASLAAVRRHLRDIV